MRTLLIVGRGNWSKRNWGRAVRNRPRGRDIYEEGRLLVATIKEDSATDRSDRSEEAKQTGALLLWRDVDAGRSTLLVGHKLLKQDSTTSLFGTKHILRMIFVFRRTAGDTDGSYTLPNNRVLLGGEGGKIR